MRALVLMSGGIDSRLASAWLEKAGHAVRWVHFRTGFSSESASRRLTVWASERGAPSLERVDVREEYLEQVVLRPRFGRPFSNPPCIDCRIFLLRRARGLAERLGCTGLVTGDVLGQGGPGQSREALERIDREAEVEGWVLRPLSAAFLCPPSRWPDEAVPADPAEAIQGRGRGPIAALARRLEIEPDPLTKGGCCLLADPAFRRRLRDALEHAAPAGVIPPLLHFGRHFRLSWNAKCVISRNAQEGAALESDPTPGWIGRPSAGPGALVKVLGDPGEEDLRCAAALCLRFSKGGSSGLVRLERVGQETSEGTGGRAAAGERRTRLICEVRAAPDDDLALWRI